MATFFALSTIAQNNFTNPGFETWSGAKPEGWYGLEMSGLSLTAITQVTDAHSGNYAVSVTMQALPIPVSGISALPGFITNGQININAILNGDINLDSLDFDNIDANTITAISNLIVGGVQMTANPVAVSGFYSWSPISENIEDGEGYMMIAVGFAEVQGTRIPVSAGFYSNMQDVFTKSVSYEPFTLNLTPFVQGVPATELIFAAIAANSAESATESGVLYLDDLSIVTGNSIENISKSNDKNFVIYPNPSQGEFRLNVKENVEFSIYNQLGQEVIANRTYTPNEVVSLKEKGIYFVRVKDQKGVKTQKLVIK
jgi:hypothetical protein